MNHPHNQLVTSFIMPQNIEGLRILDCGCGRGAWGFFIRSQIEGSAYLEGFDIFPPYIKKLRELNLYDEVYEMDIRDVGKLNKRFDVILAMDVLEHLEKDEAMKVIPELEGMCNKILIVSFPIGRWEQGIYDGNIHQIHRCSFELKEMERLGYNVRPLYKHTKSLRFIERIRCIIWGLEFKRGIFVAYKEFMETRTH